MSMQSRIQKAVAMDEEKLIAYAKRVAEGIEAERQIRLRPLLSLTMKRIQVIRRTAAAASSQEIRQTYGGAFEWISDNLYILEREYRLAAISLKGIRRLPGIVRGQYRGYIYAYYLAQKLCFAVNFRIRKEDTELFLRNAQDKCPLSNRELWLFPDMLRLALLGGIYKASVELLEILDRKRQEDIDKKTRLARLEQLMGNAITSLRQLSDLDFSESFDKISITEQILNNDPAGVYENMSLESKTYYRDLLSRMAKREGIPEYAMAEKLVSRASCEADNRERHIGTALLSYNMQRRAGQRRLYFLLLAVLPPAAAAAAGLLLSSYWISALILLPLFEAVKSLLDYLAARLTCPVFLPRLDPLNLPADASALTVISALVTGKQAAGELCERLEHFYRSNGDKGVIYGILADLRESDKETFSQQERDIVETLRQGVRELNERLGVCFALFVRGRRYCKTQRKYMGWERKRGAITELVRFIKGKPTSFEVAEGAIDKARRCKYIVTLDSDTLLTIDSVRELVGIMEHVANQPEWDAASRRVTRGYGMLQPRMNTDAERAAKTTFSAVTSGFSGIDAYSNLSFDLYQDLFGEGIFAGKGIIHVDAFYNCLDDMPEGLILSHDLLEGSYLRTGFASDVVFSDVQPNNVLAFHARQHRWVRGDWQLLRFILFDRRLPALAKWKMIDNLRRSVTPVASLLCLMLAGLNLIGGTASAAVAASALAAIFAGYIVSTADAFIRQGMSIFHLRYYSKTLPAAASGLLHSLFILLALPYTAAVNAGAIVRSLWRQLFSRRRLLDWVTAAQADIKKNSLASYYRAMWTLTAAGLSLAVWGTWCGRVLGLCWLFAPYVFYRTGRQRRRAQRPFSKEEREILMGYAADMWQYFEDFMDQKNSFLPPDNYQESPLAALATRTSPTNIGLALVSCLAARDLGLIDSDGLITRVERTIATLETMPKYEGHLYNWYDTENREPLYPRYVSTVDSGNLVCCLCALYEGLAEYAPQARELRSRIQNLIDSMNFRFLYDSPKRLFYIGYDVENKSFGEGYYDLYMSEARLTSYYAVAKRIVNKRHWFRLGRMMSVKGGHFGLRSWTGTMFEYYMPHIFLPVYENTMVYESLEYAIRRHKERVRRKGIPWGISESAYYSFDNLLNYQYKAFGVASLGLKQGLEKELVVSPYSTFLALPFDPKSAYRNLACLRKCGLYGRYGFYEAADFTRERTAGSMAVIRSFMSHHIGMSILALDNALNGNILQRRFMRHCGMSAFKELLHEKLPQKVIEYTDHIEHKEKSRYNTRAVGDRMRVDAVTPVNPKAVTLSNGSWFSLLSDSGAGFCRWNDKVVTRYRKELTENPRGVFFVANIGNRYMPLSFAPVYDNRTSYYTEFSKSEAVFSSKRGDAEGRMRVTVHSVLPGEIREIKLRNASFKRKDFCLLSYLEPVLGRHRDEYAHPAFFGLFVEAHKKDDGCVIFSRRSRGEKERNIFLCAGFAERAETVEIETRRENVLGRLSGTSRLYRAFDARFGGVSEACLDPCCAMRIYGQLAPKEVRTLHFIMAAGASPQEARQNFLQIKKEGYAQVVRKSASLVQNMLHFCSAREEEIRLADLLLPYLYFPVRNGKEDGDKRSANTRSQRDVWKYGISGEYPIVFLRVGESDDVPRALPFLRAFRLLRLKGADVDLVLQYNEGGQYDRPIYTALRDMARECGCEPYLGQRRGIHLVNTPDEGDIALLTAMSCFYVELRKGYRLSEERVKPFSPLNPDHGIAPELPYELVCKNSLGGFTKEGFVIQNKTALPSRPPWCQIYANRLFGTLVSDSALGFTYAFNARENKITPFKNDAVTDNNGERLYLRLGGRVYDVVAGGITHFTDKYAEYRCKIGNMLVVTTVFVPENELVKVVRVRCTGAETPQQFSLCYYTEPVLGVSEETHEKFVRYHTAGGVIYFNNPYNFHWRHGVAYLCCTAPRATVGFDRAAFSEGRWNRADKPSAMSCAFLSVRAETDAKGEYDMAFLLGYERNQAAAKESVARLCSRDAVGALMSRHNGQSPRNSITVKTPDRFLNQLINIHLPHQIFRSRIYARCGFYQCSGAYGFRDQLQDCMSLATLDPSLLKRQIYFSASHQFEEGDVMHWWHPLPGRRTSDMGVRTRCSDDLLWLPLAVCEYIEKTGDESILSKKARYVKGPPLKPDEQERYFQPELSEKVEDIYGHCLRALSRGVARGERGLILFGNGDWNDSMNRVGVLGRGETVWGSMFAAWVLTRFADVALKRGDIQTAQRLQTQTAELTAAVEKNAWDGGWYMRGFYDNGEPFGSSQSGECKINLLPQSFAAITRMFDPARTASALKEARSRLVDKEHGLIRLFTPPFRDTPNDPGYIKGYIAGVRENGGQYTHAAAWYALAQFVSGNADLGYEALRILNPAEKSLDISDLKTYRLEPYALAGDVYAAAGAEGRGGWSLYTGSAGWYYRVVVEYMLGIKRRGNILYFEPRLPSDWDSYSARLLLQKTRVNLVVQRGNYDCLLVDGAPAEYVPLDGGQHNALLIIH